MNRWEKATLEKFLTPTRETRYPTRVIVIRLMNQGWLARVGSDESGYPVYQTTKEGRAALGSARSK